MSMGQPAASDAKPRVFNVNEGANAETGILLPTLGDQVIPLDASTIESYTHVFERTFDTDPGTSLASTAKALGVPPPNYTAIKGGKLPPSGFAFARVAYMPDVTSSNGVAPWPGINPDSLRKIVRETIAPQLVIGMREDDIIRYSNHSSKLWRPGWRIEARDDDADSASKKEIKEAERFIMNSNVETGYTQCRERDAQRLTSFQRFLASLVRDTLTFDAIALWTDMDRQKKVGRYALLPAGNIRLTTPGGYDNDPNKFAVAVDEGGTVLQAFTRDELTFYIRNPRNDPDVYNYGYSEVEIAMRMIKGFQNALDMNIDIFDRSAIANGILTISGGTVTQRQLDFLNRLMTNMKKGVTKTWTLPVIGLQGDAKLELLDLSRLKGNEAYYKEFMNMLAGALCTLWRFPVRRLGYRISGGSRDAEPLPDAVTERVDENDPGLPPLLTHIETLINEYILWTRWPNLQFRFTGKTPAEDARQYEAQSLAKTYGERRAESGLPPLESLAKGSEEKKIARLMTLAPMDPNLSGIYQSIAGTAMEPEPEPGLPGAGEAGGPPKAKPGNRMTSKKDPAKARKHGHESGVRRDSNKEGKRSAKATRPYSADEAHEDNVFPKLDQDLGFETDDSVRARQGDEEAQERLEEQDAERGASTV